MAGNLTAMMASIFRGGVTADPFFEYTTLLLPGNGTNGAQNNTFLDGSTNNFTITRNGNTTQGTFSPFSQTGWGNYFSGSNYISYASSVDFSPGAGSFTVEFWCYPLNTSAGSRGVVSNGYGTNTWHVSQQGANIVFYIGTTGLTATSILTANTWQHIACVRNGSTNAVTIYKNGTSFVSGTNATNSSTTNIVTIGTSAHATTEYFVGYISNARMVKGVEVYTGNFTEPTSPLASTQSAGTNISAITGTQTSFLTCQSNRFIDNSVTPKTITATGSPTVVAFSPFNPTASWSAATNGGSGYFDGSGDYLTLPAGTAFAPGTGDFTIDGWFYASSFSGDPIIWSQTTSGSNYFMLYVSAASNTLIFIGSNISTSGAANLVLNAWNYFSVRRSSGTVTVYTNGTAGTGGSNTSDLNNTTYVPTIGRYTHTAANVFTGYIANLRYVKGTAITPSGVPTTLNTAVSGTSALLNFTNAGIYDATSKNDLETVGAAAISTAQNKWGGSSIIFNGSTAYLYGPTSRMLVLGSGDFTVEGWFYFNSVASGVLLDWRSDGAGFDFYLSTGTLNLSTSGTYYGGTSGITLVTGQWYHIALTRSGTAWRIYVNGTSYANITNSTNFTATILRVGYGTGATYFNGYLQDLRLTPGYARYTGASYTVPTAAFPTL